MDTFDLSLISDRWKGFERYTFYYEERESYIVFPDSLENCIMKRRVAWRTEFFGVFDQVDVELLKRGWILLYHKVSDLYGSPEAISKMKSFHTMIIDRFGIPGSAVLIGLSRGGLYAVNYAAAFPECTDALYLDNAVLDLRSWPGGYGKGIGDERCWDDCLEIYGHANDKDAFLPRPLDKAEIIADERIPVIAVAGTADDIVPYDENLKPFCERIKLAGGHLLVIEKPGFGHHPHSLEDPKIIADFLDRALPRT